jgi:hypothetical protein
MILNCRARCLPKNCKNVPRLNFPSPILKEMSARTFILGTYIPDDSAIGAAPKIRVNSCVFSEFSLPCRSNVESPIVKFGAQWVVVL